MVDTLTSGTPLARVIGRLPAGRVTRRACLLLLCWAWVLPPLQAQDRSADSPRHSRTVRLVQRCLPSVVALSTYRRAGAGKVVLTVGSGSVIHPDGYVLTNDHVVSGAVRGQAAFADGRVHAYEIVARLPSEDLALLKVRAGRALPALDLGRSNDLLLGEPVLVIGNPGGLAHSVSSGIVSGLNRATSSGQTYMPQLIQTSAAVNGGNSGGPLINALGQQIGVVSSKRPGAENISFAIAIDRVRQLLPRMLAAEQRYGCVLGLEVDMLEAEARVKTVATGSPAALAGLRPGDRVRRVAGGAIRHGLDLQLALIGRKAGQLLPLQVLRGKQTLTLTPRLAALSLPRPRQPGRLRPGLRWSAYVGSWDRLPDFNRLRPVAGGITSQPALAAYKKGADRFGLLFRGWVKIPRDGLYTFYAASDDGSQLLVGGRMVVDNDGLHSRRIACGHMRLPAGLHSLQIRFFEKTGGQALAVELEGPGLPRQALPVKMLLHSDPVTQRKR